MNCLNEGYSDPRLYGTVLVNPFEKSCQMVEATMYALEPKCSLNDVVENVVRVMTIIIGILAIAITAAPALIGRMIQIIHYHSLPKKKQPQEVSENINVTSKPFFNLDDFISKCATNKQAMVYGLFEGKYLEISRWLDTQKNMGFFNDVFDFFLGEECNNENEYTTTQHITSDHRVISKINSGSDALSRRACKAALVNMVIENFKRRKEELPTIPIIFSVGKDDDVKLDIHAIANRASPKSKGMTNSEIRRAYKLCFDPGLSEEIRTIAKESFLFISLTTNDATAPVEFDFTIIQAPWETSCWETGWAERIKTKSVKADPNPYPWRGQLIEHVKES